MWNLSAFYAIYLILITECLQGILEFGAKWFSSGINELSTWGNRWIKLRSLRMTTSCQIHVMHFDNSMKLMWLNCVCLFLFLFCNAISLVLMFAHILRPQSSASFNAYHSQIFDFSFIIFVFFFRVSGFGFLV